MTLGIQTRKLKDLLAIRRQDGSVIGFHSRNLQVARLSPESWDAFEKSPTTEDEQDAVGELQAWEESHNELLKKEKQTQGVRALSVNVTQVCNLHCRYCAAGGDGSYGDPIKRIVVKETFPTLQNFIRKVPLNETFRLTFLGGEPLLYPEGIALLAEEATRLGQESGVRIEFTVVTNGTLMTPATLELLSQYKMDITISLDGPAQINDQRRPGKGGQGMTSQVEKGLGLLREQKQNLGRVMLSGVFGNGNLDLVQAFNYYRQFDVDWFDFTYDHHETSPAINQQFMSQMATIAELAYQTEGEAGLRRVHTFHRLFEILDQQQQIENYCGAGKSFLMLDARQNLYTCPWVVNEPNEVVGSQGQVWEEKLKPYEPALLEKHGCQGCWARYTCGGGCMYIHKQVTGDKHRVDPNYCERTRFLLATTLSYYERLRG